MIPKAARLLCISFIVTSALEATGPPPDLLQRILTRESEAEAARAHYAYRQRVRIEEIEVRGRKRGEYRELRDVVFSPEGQRFENMIGRPYAALDRLQLTEEDFRDIREVQPFLFTREQLRLYQTQYKGDETVNGIPCWVIQVSPRQILQGQRLFEGMVWVHQEQFVVIKLEGRAVPQIIGRKQENLFPRFTTMRRQVDGRHWFPDKTIADDVLQFRTGPLRIRMEIEFTRYQRFGAESTITFGEPRP